MVTSLDERPCPRHPAITTRLRCSKCGTPICPRCMVETLVGFRCPACAGLSGLSWSDVPRALLLRAALAGFAVALVVGWLWSRFPSWQFYLALLLGFGVAEAMAWAARNQRGQALQAFGVLCVGVGLVLSRSLLLVELGLAPEELPRVLSDSRLWTLLQLRPIPDLVFAAMALVIPFVRFRVTR
ncbi:MAG: B-box zinc finger protein [Thermomicrobium sp.]|nr:B-box zinc finger protein [Thermomicrobium sp.]MDW8058777.1 B-box zinc finger protein [Thermomicrobium sp.]